jgi:hypothetical protein
MANSRAEAVAKPVTKCGTEAAAVTTGSCSELLGPFSVDETPPPPLPGVFPVTRGTPLFLVPKGDELVDALLPTAGEAPPLFFTAGTRLKGTLTPAVEGAPLFLFAVEPGLAGASIPTKGIHAGELAPASPALATGGARAGVQLSSEPSSFTTQAGAPLLPGTGPDKSVAQGYLVSGKVIVALRGFAPHDVQVRTSVVNPCGTSGRPVTEGFMGSPVYSSWITYGLSARPVGQKAANVVVYESVHTQVGQPHDTHDGMGTATVTISAPGPELLEKKNIRSMLYEENQGQVFMGILT